MKAEEVLQILLLQLRNNFALTDDEAKIIASPEFACRGLGG